MTVAQLDDRRYLLQSRELNTEAASLGGAEAASVAAAACASVGAVAAAAVARAALAAFGGCRRPSFAAAAGEWLVSASPRRGILRRSPCAAPLARRFANLCVKSLRPDP